MILGRTERAVFAALEHPRMLSQLMEATGLARWTVDVALRQLERKKLARRENVSTHGRLYLWSRAVLWNRIANTVPATAASSLARGALTKCKRGHEFPEERSGSVRQRRCRVCLAAAKRAYRARLKAAKESQCLTKPSCSETTTSKP